MSNKKLISLTEEHKAQIHPWHERWIKIAMRTKPQTEDEREIMRAAVKGLYKAANLEMPRYIIFGDSPVSCQITAGGSYFAMNTKTSLNLNIQTDNPIIKSAIKTLEQIIGPEKLVKNEKKPVKVDDTKLNWGRQMVIAMLPHGKAKDVDALCDEIKVALNAYSGGNMWSAGVDFISFFRHVVGLDIDYTEWDHYEKASMFGGFRYMYADFCAISDFPKHISLDNGNVAHNDEGPSHAWRDGFEIFNWHGILIAPEYQWIIKTPEKLTPVIIANERNSEMRRIMLEKFGFEKYLEAGKAETVAKDTDGNGFERLLLSLTVGSDRISVLQVINGSLEADGSRRKFHIGAMPGRNPHECVAASYGINPAKYREAVRT